MSISLRPRPQVDLRQVSRYCENTSCTGERQHVTPCKTMSKIRIDKKKYTSARTARNLYPTAEAHAKEKQAMQPSKIALFLAVSHWVSSVAWLEPFLQGSCSGNDHVPIADHGSLSVPARTQASGIRRRPSQGSASSRRVCGRADRGKYRSRLHRQSHAAAPCFASGGPPQSLLLA